MDINDLIDKGYRFNLVTPKDGKDIDDIESYLNEREINQLDE